MTRTMYDSLYNLSSIPWQPGNLIMAYINGVVSAGNYAEAMALFPKAQILSVTTNGDPNALAEICDCETGDYTPQRAAAWRVAGSGSTIYASRYTWPIVRSLIPASLPTSWLATTLDGTTDVPGSVGVQYTDTGLYDISIITDDTWFSNTLPILGGKAMLPCGVVANSDTKQQYVVWPDRTITPITTEAGSNAWMALCSQSGLQEMNTQEIANIKTPA